MDEEAMWKGFYEKIQEQKNQPNTEHQAIIQDSDGRFFEKFGSILRQKSINHEQSVTLAPLPEQAEDGITISMQESIPEYDDSGNETLPDSDSEEQQEKQNEFIGDAFGWNANR